MGLAGTKKKGPPMRANAPESPIWTAKSESSRMTNRTLLTAARLVAKSYLAYKAGNIAYIGLILTDEELALMGNIPSSLWMMTRNHSRLLGLALVVFTTASLIMTGSAA
jgi:hypothetical protein